MSPLVSVARAASRLVTRRSAVSEAEAVLTVAVADALATGVPATQIAETLGVSRARVYQIRDGTR